MATVTIENYDSDGQLQGTETREVPDHDNFENRAVNELRQILGRVGNLTITDATDAIRNLAGLAGVRDEGAVIPPILGR